MKSPKPRPRPTKPTLTADTVIADLRSQITALRTEMRLAEMMVAELRESKRKAYDDVTAWRAQGEDARQVAVDMRKLLDDAFAARMHAEGQLRFAEGYLTAFKGESYRRNET